VPVEVLAGRLTARVPKGAQVAEGEHPIIMGAPEPAEATLTSSLGRREVREAANPGSSQYAMSLAELDRLDGKHARGDGPRGFVSDGTWTFDPGADSLLDVKQCNFV